MQTVELVRQLENAAARLRAPELLAFVRGKLSPLSNGGDQSISGETRADFSQLLFDSNAALSRLRDDPKAAEVLTAFDIVEIYTPDKLGRMVTFVNSAQLVSQLRTGADGFFLFREFELGLANLARVEGALKSLVLEPRIASIQPNEGVLELQVIDVDGNGIPASKLAIVLTQLQELSIAIEAVVADDPSSSQELRIAYADSGSDILLALQGHEKTLAMIGAAFVWMWGQLRFARNANLERDLESIAKGVEALTLLEAKRKEKIVDAATADRLRNTILTRLQKLVEHGVAPPDLPRGEDIQHKQLIKDVAQRKRLVSGDQTPPDK